MSPTPPNTTQSPITNRIKWIDGLRGIAAFVVAFNHYFCSEFPMPFRTYGTEPPEENQRLIQLPPIKFLWSMKAMVLLFMVISGYSASRSLLETRDNRPEQLTDRLRSSICRRPFRLLLPVLAIAVPSQVAFYCDLFKGALTEDFTAWVQPWTSPWHHVLYVCAYMADNLEIVQLQWNLGVNAQTWTIPLDLRGSYVVYFMIFVQAAWSPYVRVYSLGMTVLYFLRYGRWDIFCFLAGLGLAEINTIHDRTGDYRRFLGGSVSFVLRLALGVYLFCLSGEADTYPADYGFLGSIQPTVWSRWGWVEARQTWNAIGAVLLFSVCMQSSRTQRFLSLRLFQYLGRLSFPIYLCHVLVYQVIRRPLRDHVWWLLEKREYPGNSKAAESFDSLLIALVISGVLCGSVVFLVAELYAQFVDPQLVRLTRKIDIWVNQKEETCAKIESWKNQ
ncbi:uncharacterized protein N7511_009598 [Penicillium nucicola]|uniref:uncharacterized protein n=1 Tax=Penicillium nucicola TaxID=1850975 RepID=UPI002545BB53|nr:uncharacterized protein N7511_009598 [Penicillium nucicola]KAJ5747902.1 hypothetical protein N7511_009598 [Penicillium nucicola]